MRLTAEARELHAMLGLLLKQNDGAFRTSAKRECLGQFGRSLETIVWAHGRLCPVDYLQGRLRCPRCGSTHVTLMWITPPTAEAITRP